MDVSFIHGSTELIKWFGAWPTFQDAEIDSIELHAKNPSKISLRTWQLTNEVDQDGSFVLGKKCLVTFTFKEVTNLMLEDFSPQNVIYGLKCDRMNDVTIIDFQPCYGVNGFVSAKSVSIEFKPI